MHCKDETFTAHAIAALRTRHYCQPALQAGTLALSLYISHAYSSTHAVRSSDLAGNCTFSSSNIIIVTRNVRCNTRTTDVGAVFIHFITLTLLFTTEKLRYSVLTVLFRTLIISLSEFSVCYGNSTFHNPDRSF